MLLKLSRHSKYKIDFIEAMKNDRFSEENEKLTAFKEFCIGNFFKISSTMNT